MAKADKNCFVCKMVVSDKSSELNLTVNLPVCRTCKGSVKEKKTEKELLDSLADGFVCGCI